ncbi:MULTISPECIES: NUDIX domain-containing protein [unclassified Shouchella]
MYTLAYEAAIREMKEETGLTPLRYANCLNWDVHDFSLLLSDIGK